MTRFLHGKIHLKDFSRSSAARGGRDSGLSEHSAHRDEIDAASAATVAVSYSVKLLVGPGEGGGRAEAEAAAAQALDPVFSRVARFYPLSLISKMPEREKQFLVLLTLKIRSKRPLQSPFEP